MGTSLCNWIKDPRSCNSILYKWGFFVMELVDSICRKTGEEENHYNRACCTETSKCLVKGMLVYTNKILVCNVNINELGLNLGEEMLISQSLISS